ncbi:MAG: NUDIX hydrolase [Actinobacteria bacterium]|nr:NUDIX hydrolase [Actinomycetota bacterium]
MGDGGGHRDQGRDDAGPARGEGGLHRVGGKLVHKGPIASVRMDTFEYPDGSTSTRQVVVHPGSVAIIPHDGRAVYLVRQPREPVGEASLLELPAGKLDVEGETPLECARRELAEEIGKAAGDWRELKAFYTSPGFATERCHLFLATELYDVDSEPPDYERIEIVRQPLDRLDEAIADCADAASLVGLLMLRDLL